MGRITPLARFRSWLAGWLFALAGKLDPAYDVWLDGAPRRGDQSLRRAGGPEPYNPHGWALTTCAKCGSPAVDTPCQPCDLANEYGDCTCGEPDLCDACWHAKYADSSVPDRRMQ